MEKLQKIKVRVRLSSRNLGNLKKFTCSGKILRWVTIKISSQLESSSPPGLNISKGGQTYKKNIFFWGDAKTLKPAPSGYSSAANAWDL